MALRLKEKELACVGISVVTGCKPCTDYHVKAAREARASDEEIKQAVADALAVRRGATEIMEGYALAKLGAEAYGSNTGRAGETNRVKALDAEMPARRSTCEAALPLMKAAIFTIFPISSRVMPAFSAAARCSSRFETQLTPNAAPAHTSAFTRLVSLARPLLLPCASAPNLASA